MKINVLLFAGAAESVGKPIVQVEVSGLATLRDLARELSSLYPQLGDLMAMSRWSIDRQFMPMDSRIAIGQEIAMIPPVSGG